MKDDDRDDELQLYTVKQIAFIYRRWLTVAKLRWYIFRSHQNGLAKALVKIGGRVYIDLIEFREWLKKQRLAPV